MKIKELKELLKEQGNEYYDIEVYKYTFDNHKSIHTDYITSIEDYNDNTEVEDYQLMNEEDYNNSILANSSKQADFEEWYDDKDAIVLVVIMKENDGEE